MCRLCLLSWFLVVVGCGRSPNKEPGKCTVVLTEADQGIRVAGTVVSADRFEAALGGIAPDCEAPHAILVRAGPRVPAKRIATVMRALATLRLRRVRFEILDSQPGTQTLDYEIPGDAPYVASEPILHLAVRVVVDSAGRFDHGAGPVTDPQLCVWLRQQTSIEADDRTGEVCIDETVPFARLVEVLRVLRDCDLDTIWFRVGPHGDLRMGAWTYSTRLAGQRPVPKE